ncbi:MAG: hypothetical protein JWR55_392, partial [Aeromicrobium sp.]|nr:hypothetical protein [Aeromicrobium sp.]
MIGRRSHDDAFEDALRGATPQDEQIADLVRLAEHICQSAVAEPSPTFRDSLRAQLMTEAATVLVPAPPVKRRASPARAAPYRPARRRIASLTAAAIASAGVVGLVASSASAVPGELLYPVKRTVESVELQLHRDDASRGEFQLERASERLAEAKRLTADGESSALIADTLDDFATTAADGSGRLFTEFDSTGKTGAIVTVNQFAGESSLDLAALSAQLPKSVSASFDAAKDTVTDLAARASSLCGSCTPADVDALVRSVADVAASTPAKKSDDPTGAGDEQPSPSAPKGTS